MTWELLLRNNHPEFHYVLSCYMRHRRDPVYISESFVYFTKFSQRNFPSESNLQAPIFSLCCQPEPWHLSHHAGQQRSCTAILMFGWTMLSYLWKCDFSSPNPTLLSCLQQGLGQLNVSHLVSLGVLSMFQKGHVFPLIPGMWEQETRLCTATSKTLANSHATMWSGEEALDLPSLRLKKQCKPGTEFPQILRCLLEHWKGDAGWGSEKESKCFETEQPFSDCALLLTPETAGSACGPARTVHMDTSKESTEMLWHFSLSWVNCAWSTLESHRLSKEETEQRNDCNTFLLKHPAAEAARSGSSRCLCWTTGTKSKWYQDAAHLLGWMWMSQSTVEKPS